MGVVPARGGSKGLPGKNIKLLRGKPLIAWTLTHARASRLLDRVFVSTDSTRIAGVAAEWGAPVPFLRPKKMAGDRSRVIDAILHALDRFESEGERFDYVALLEPTSPLRRADDIDRAIRLLVGAGDSADCVVSVGEIALEHPAYAKKIGRRGFVESYLPRIGGGSLRQELPRAYFPYGVIYLSSTQFLRRSGQAYGGRILPLEIERWQNYEINDIFDFRCVEAILGEKGTRA